MKIVIASMMTLVVTSAFGQKKDFKENTLTEISCLIANPYEFLDKSDSAILAAGRPASIRGGDKWEVGAIDSSEKDKGMGEMIVIGTGCGALTLIVSPVTKVVDVILYIPHKKARIDEDDVVASLNGKYVFDNKGDAVIEVNGSKPVKLSVSGGMIVMGND